MSQSNHPKLIHVGEHLVPGEGKRRLFLREEGSGSYRWFDENEAATDVAAPTVNEALRLAHRTWKNNGFRTLICGFRYTLPERDEHGMNALFHQMAASHNSFNGVYFDEELGHNCFVQNASLEALNLLKQLEESNRL